MKDLSEKKDIYDIDESFVDEKNKCVCIPVQESKNLTWGDLASQIIEKVIRKYPAHNIGSKWDFKKKGPGIREIFWSIFHPFSKRESPEEYILMFFYD